jgi:hypothetical protein
VISTSALYPAVAGQVAGPVVGPAHHLVRRVIAVAGHGGAVDRDPGPVPRQVVAVGKAAPRRLHRPGQLLQPVIGVGDGPRDRGARWRSGRSRRAGRSS